MTTTADAPQHRPAVERRRLGDQLRQLRHDRSLRLEDVAAKLGVAPSTLSRIETGQAPTRTSYVSLMLDLYGVDDPSQRRQLADMARQGQRKGWWARYRDVPPGTAHYLAFESATSSIRSYSSQAIPDLLQAEAYSAALIRAANPGISVSQLRELVGMISRRQEVLEHDGFRLHAVVDEHVLLSTLGSREVMAAQHGHLAAVAATRTVTLQVIPLASTRNVASPSFTLLSFTHPGDADLVSTTGIGGQVIIARRAADIATAKSAFTALAKLALPPAESARLITQLAGRQPPVARDSS